MKKFARCVLILILVTVLSGVIGYAVVSNKTTSMYTSTTQLYVVPGVANEASLRTSDGSLNEDFSKIFTSSVVISDAQKTAGTSEDIASYITVKTPANTNIVEIICTNPDQNTAKAYVDAVAKSAIKTTSIIPVEKISILTEGTSTGVSIKPNIYKFTQYITIGAALVCVILECIICLFLCAFKKVDDDDDDGDYNKFYGGNIEPVAVVPNTMDDTMKSISKEPIYTPVQQEHGIEPDILENEEDDDFEETVLIDKTNDQNQTLTLVDETEEVASEMIENEAAVTAEESSSEVLGRIPR